MGHCPLQSLMAQTARAHRVIEGRNTFIKHLDICQDRFFVVFVLFCYKTAKEEEQMAEVEMKGV